MAEFSEPVFAKVDPNLIRNFRSDSRFLQPVLVIYRNGDGELLSSLEGWRSARDNLQRYKLPTIFHDWLEDDGIVRRIPPDAPRIVSGLLDFNPGEPLAFVKAMELSRRQSDISVHIEPNVYELSDFVQLNEIDKLPGLNATLFEYQSKGVAWMADRALRIGGFILADEMGLGKTIQIIALFLKARSDPRKPILVVAPTTLLTNWQQELLRFAPSLTHFLHRGSSRTGISRDLLKADIVITTYDTLVSDSLLMATVQWSWVILDEAQAVRNPETARRKALENIPRDHLVPMTGTPVETTLRDLWSLMDLAVPGLLGTLDEFEATYQDDLKGAGALSSIVGSLILRRRVEDVAADLPDRIDVEVPIDADPAYYEAYREVRDSVIQKFPQAGHLVAVNQLSMHCAHHAFAQRDGEDISAIISDLGDDQLLTPKLEVTTQILFEAFTNNRKVLIFSSYNGTVELMNRVSGTLPTAYWNSINGATKQPDRQKIVEEFSAFEGPGCLVLNPNAAGAGLNITAATIVIHYTLYWNPALEAQASARAYRRGQTQPVRIYRLYYPNTVEQIMLERSLRRREMGDAVMQDAEAEKADLQRAITMGKDPK